jgi:hypothetical protein
MQNKIALIVTVIFCLVLFGHCTKMATESPNAVSNGMCSAAFPEKQVSYNGYVKQIISSYCTNSCHNGDALAPGDFRTYQGLLPYVQQFYFRVIQDRADMPQGAAPLPRSIRDSLNIWIENCAPEN